MTDLKTLEKKVNKLEERLKKIEDKIASLADTEEKAWMDQLYTKAKELVVRHNKASVMFLQRKLLIDNVRAKKILDELQANGVIGAAEAGEQRKILVKK
jgi:S-DNA-T family DNA segregation ATPase FtsK/SpoIIIE